MWQASDILFRKRRHEPLQTPAWWAAAHKLQSWQKIFMFRFLTRAPRSKPYNCCLLRKAQHLSPHHQVQHSYHQFLTMTEITHPTIKDGWFREISDMWPGQAMTLKVNQVVHHEKSKYQDVLIFESSDYGMVLVLDNVIQCTERDEFSYQEMITHLGMFSHPNPKKVLVIGGGDGGVLREVVKHESVEEAILCDIDEAVIRLSKKYLPGMSVGFNHPNVKVHVGDGFKFLEDYKDTFDVIITDSSDPEGPAEALFQKPYFELLHGALREGGIITTQGCKPSPCPSLVRYSGGVRYVLLTVRSSREPMVALEYD